MRTALLRMVDNASLALFRIAFGALMLHHVYVEYAGYGGFQQWFVDPAFHFTYYGFGWVRPVPEFVQHGFFFAQGLACMGIMLGLAYRISASVNFLVVTYYFLLEKSLFLNHAYLICLISFLIILLPLHRRWSLDARLRPALGADSCQTWVLWLLRFQVGVVYFYGGIAKLNWDWLHGEPMRTYLADWAERPVIGALATGEPAVWFFSGGGLLLDLLVVPALLWQRTRVPAFLAAATFHLSNAYLFHIAIFPWFMLAATLLFFPPNWPTALWARLRNRPLVPTVQGVGTLSPIVGVFLAVWISAQALVPFRHFLYPGNPSWTEEGHNFAWRMMLRHKAVESRFVWYTVTNNATGEVDYIDPHDRLPRDEAATLYTNPQAMQRMASELIAEYRAKGITNITVQAEVRLIQFSITNPATGATRHANLPDYVASWQVDTLCLDPDLILQLAHEITRREAAEGRTVQVRVEVWASLHGRPYRPLVDSTVDLAAQRRNLWPKPWIAPMGAAS